MWWRAPTRPLWWRSGVSVWITQRRGTRRRCTAVLRASGWCPSAGVCALPDSKNTETPVWVSELWSYCLTPSTSQLDFFSFTVKVPVRNIKHVWNILNENDRHPQCVQIVFLLPLISFPSLPKGIKFLKLCTKTKKSLHTLHDFIWTRLKQSRSNSSYIHNHLAAMCLLTELILIISCLPIKQDKWMLKAQ